MQLSFSVLQSGDSNFFARSELGRGLFVSDDPDFKAPEGGGADAVKQADPGVDIPRPILLTVAPQYRDYRYPLELRRQASEIFARVQEDLKDKLNHLARFVKILENNPALVVPFGDAILAVAREKAGQPGEASIMLLANWVGVLTYATDSATLTDSFNARFGTFADYIRQMYEAVHSFRESEEYQLQACFASLLMSLGKNPAWPKENLPALIDAFRWHCQKMGADKREVQELIDMILAARADIHDGEVS